MRCLLSLILYFSSFSALAENDDLVFYEIDPFYNFSLEYKKADLMHLNSILNPVKLDISNYKGAIKLNNDDAINITALKGESIYKGLIIANDFAEKKLKVNIGYPLMSKPFDESNTDINLVTSWFQAGKYTLISKKYKYLTHELLLKNDYQYSFDDKWVFKDKKWSYVPPELNNNTGFVSTILPTNDSRRLLLKINIPVDVDAGKHALSINITDAISGKVVRVIPIEIDINDRRIATNLRQKYDLFIYTFLSLDPNIGRRGTYINGQNNFGNYEYQKSIYKKHVNNIKSHGFNSLIVLDWREPYLSASLSILKKAGIKNVAIYATSPVKNKSDIVSEQVVSTFKEFEFSPIYYGFDEPGGNKKLAKQLDLNVKINSLGAKSFNACYWEDKSNVLTLSETNSEKGFSYLTYSLGSHGSDDFINSLPLDKNDDLKQLAYWHPHVENPVRNKLLMGYWLWASGLDGVSPHGYYFLPHISKYLGTEGVNHDAKPSPYDDFSMWDKPSGKFRQHATVYPERNGVVSTLQWEAIFDGATDLALVLQLEDLLNNNVLSSKHTVAAGILLAKIKRYALIKNTSALTNKDNKKYIALMNSWKKKIKSMIIS